MLFFIHCLLILQFIIFCFLTTLEQNCHDHSCDGYTFSYYISAQLFTSIQFIISSPLCSSIQAVFICGNFSQLSTSLQMYYLKFNFCDTAALTTEFLLLSYYSFYQAYQYIATQILYLFQLSFHLDLTTQSIYYIQASLFSIIFKFHNRSG